MLELRLNVLFLRFEAENVPKMLLNLHGMHYLISQCGCDQEPINYLDTTLYHLMTLMVWI